MARTRVESRGSRVGGLLHLLDCRLSVQYQGQALVETALALVIFLVALPGGIDFYLYEWDAWKVQEVAREMVAAVIDAPSEEAARQWLAQRSAEEVRAKGFSAALDRAEMVFPDGQGYGPGKRVQVDLTARHRFLFLVRPAIESAPVRATAGGLVKPNRNWEP